MAEPRTHVIWSHKWQQWHRRDPATGAAAGYTTRLEEAGVFEASVARSYAGEPTINETYPLTQVGWALVERWADLTRQVRAIEEMMKQYGIAAPAEAAS